MYLKMYSDHQLEIVFKVHDNVAEVAYELIDLKCFSF